MIDVSNVDLVKFAQKVYELSIPRGLGFTYDTSVPLTKEEAEFLIHRDRHVVLSMDYVKGRGCKMSVFKKDGKLWISGTTWYDHSDTQLKELLETFGITPPKPSSHGKACDCVDCKKYESFLSI